MPQDASDEIVLNQYLESLNLAGWRLAALLDGLQVPGCDAALLKSLSENIRRGYCILNREIYANAADGRHGVGRIADTEQTVFIPPAQTIDGDGQQAHLVPLPDLRSTVREEGGDSPNVPMECV